MSISHFQGTCFPKNYNGGLCFGTPLECQRCNSVLRFCQRTVEDRPEETRLPSVKGQGAKTTASKKMPENCEQKCNNNGSCTTEYVGPYRAGPNKGSCFPKRFGGQCRNIPPECDACNKVQECPQPWERWRQQCKKTKIDLWWAFEWN